MTLTDVFMACLIMAKDILHRRLLRTSATDFVLTPDFVAHKGATAAIHYSSNCCKMLPFKYVSALKKGHAHQ